MRYFQFFAVDYATGATLPNATVSVYQTGTTTPVALYDKTGTSISNPVTASNLGLVSFAVANGTYDIAITALGGQSKPTMQGVQIVDELALPVRTITHSTPSPTLSLYDGQVLADTSAGDIIITAPVGIVGAGNVHSVMVLMIGSGGGKVAITTDGTLATEVGRIINVNDGSGAGCLTVHMYSSNVRVTGNP